MQAHRPTATVGDRGELILENLPFEPGQSVEVLVVSCASPSADGEHRNLRGSVIEYRDPFEPVATNEWEALR